MSLPRLILVTRRFWPLIGGAEIMMARLAAEFQARGATTTLLTARWQSDWPAEIDHHGVRVVRLPQPRLPGWGRLRYLSSLSKWLTRHRGKFDLVYVSTLKHDAATAVDAGAAGRFPVVLRAAASGLAGDCHWQLEARGGLRIKKRCLRAAALVASSPAAQRELVAAGYPRDRIHYLPNGVRLPERKTSVEQQEARAALAAVNPLLALPDDARVAVYTGRLHESKGLEMLVSAWPHVLKAWPSARLWLVGEGPERAALARLTNELGLGTQVVMPGAFDDIDDFLLAADLFVLPSHETGLSLALLEAMARGLPIVASNITAHQTLVEDGITGHLVSPDDPETWAATVSQLLSDNPGAAQLGLRGRERAQSEFSLTRLVDGHLALFERLLA